MERRKLKNKTYDTRNENSQGRLNGALLQEGKRREEERREEAYKSDARGQGDSVCVTEWLKSHV